MAFSPTAIVLPAVICCLLIGPADLPAQQNFTPSPSGAPLMRQSPAPATTAQQRPRPRGRAIVIGALIGAGTALALTGAAAARYGENEGGEFCGACMVQWSVVTVPVGAGIGAGIGYGIERSRRSIVAAPMFSRRSAGVVIAARF